MSPSVLEYIFRMHRAHRNVHMMVTQVLWAFVSHAPCLIDLT